MRLYFDTRATFVLNNGGDIVCKWEQDFVLNFYII